jgi:DNA-binding MarR family transcriptional regulator
MKSNVSNPNRAALQQSLVREIRRFIAGSVLFNQRLADRLGINATDYQILNLIELLGRPTPGDLARLTGLTTGGVTVALDRLENDGYVKRERNPVDRRSILVSAVPARMRKIAPLYKSINEHMHRLFSAYSEKQLVLVLEFFTRATRSRQNDNSR